MLDEWFADIPVNLVAEHGSKIRRKDSTWETLVRTSENWRSVIGKVMLQYVKRCANTFIEEKEFGMVWHYRNADMEQAKLRTIELHAELNELARHLNMQVVLGNKTVEVKSSGADKGSVISSQIIPGAFDFIFAAGDDKTDEDMFRVLISHENAFTVKVGPQASFAKYNLHTPQMVVSLLWDMSKYNVFNRRGTGHVSSIQDFTK